MALNVPNNLIMTSEDRNLSNIGNKSAVVYAVGQVGIIPRIPYTVCIYFILILGLIGNILVFVLMLTSRFRSLSYSMYLRCLAIFDSLVLIFTCMEDILDYQFRILQQLQSTHVAICKVWTYTLTISRFISPWFIVALTLDRFVAVVLPLKRQSLCSLKTATRVSASLAILSVLEGIFVLVLYDVDTPRGKIICSAPDNSALHTYEYVQGLFLQSTLPCAIILVFNIHIITAIRRSNTFRDSFSFGDRGGRTKVEKVTISLIAVSLMAFCTLTPKATLEVAELFWQFQYERAVNAALASNTTEPEAPGYLELASDVWPLLNLISLVNFGQNFYIMIITGPRYREALRTFCRRRPCSSKDKEGSGHQSTNQDTQSFSMASTQRY